MAKMIEITVLNSKLKKEYPIGTSLNQIIQDQNITCTYPIVGARVNNEIEELSYEIFRPKIVEFFDITNIDGMRMYIRSLSFVLQKAVKELYPKARLRIEHSISKGFYCELLDFGKEIKAQVISDIENRMRKIIEANIPFSRKEMLADEAIKIFQENNFHQKVKLFRTCPEFYTSVYYLGDRLDYFYGYLVPSTGYLKVFDLVKYFEGILLRVPKCSNPEELEDIIEQNKLFDIFQEHKHWAEILDVNCIGAINESVANGNAGEIIKISEALHEKKLAQIADEIYLRKEKVKLVLIAGPSSSGKTTTCKRLSIQLKVAGFRPVQISLDNYFVDREKTPKDEKGEYDFEALEAIDIEQFNSDLLNLMDGKEVEIPKFSFTTGKRYYDGEKLKLESNGIIVIEGIHGLNPGLTPHIPAEAKFKVYVSALTQIGIDGHNRIPTTDNRLIRRMVRDFRYRGYSALDTLRRWPSVRRGEDKNIFPFQEEADAIFNSALLYELAVLKPFAEKILKDVKIVDYEYSEAQRLLKFLSYFKEIETEEIPPTSILREFLKGSSFSYK